MERRQKTSRARERRPRTPKAMAAHGRHAHRHRARPLRKLSSQNLNGYFRATTLKYKEVYKIMDLPGHIWGHGHPSKVEGKFRVTNSINGGFPPSP